jgi:hypothetical protein
MGAQSNPFSQESSFVPIPAKLVQKIKSGVFVDMKELLPDNHAAKEENQSNQPNDKQPRLREITREVRFNKLSEHLVTTTCNVLLYYC